MMNKEQKQNWDNLVSVTSATKHRYTDSMAIACADEEIKELHSMVETRSVLMLAAIAVALAVGCIVGYGVCEFVYGIQ